MRRAAFFVVFAFVFVFSNIIYAETASEKQIKWAAGQASKIHKLELKNTVGTVILEDMDELIDVLRKSFRRDYPGRRYEMLQKIGEKIGFYVDEIETEDDLIRNYAQNIAGFYDPLEKAIFVISRELREEIEASIPDERNMSVFSSLDPVWEDWLRKHQEDITLVHEITHAMQDQNFDLVEWQDQYSSNTDSILAVKTVIEGLAEITELYMVSNDAEIILREFLDFYEYLGENRENERLYDTQDPILDSGQDVSYQYKLTYFPYIYGFALIQRQYLKKGWSGTHDLHYDYPMSTEQVIHPEKFFDKKKLDWPTFIMPPDLYDVLPENYVFQDSDSMGEYRIYILLKDLIFTSAEAMQVSEGWDGDRYLAFENTDTEDISFSWLTIWDTENDAEEFFEFYKNIIDHKSVSASVLHSNGTSYLLQTSWDLIFVERRGDMVLVVEGFNDRDVLDEIVEKMFEAEVYEAIYDDWEVFPEWYEDEIEEES
ncbi:MAG TPA: hypothetical protein PLN69_02780 [bacterium]|nr:hypothetical protein [bacterium]